MLAYNVRNLYDTIILVGTGGAGSPVFRRMFHYLSILGYEKMQGRDVNPINIYVFEPDNVDDMKTILKTGFFRIPKLQEDDDGHITTPKTKLLHSNVPKNSLIDSVVDTLYIANTYFTAEKAEYFVQKTNELGRILVIDATDKKSVTVPIHYSYLKPNDNLIVVGYDAPELKDNPYLNIDFQYTIYINPPEEIASSFKSVYESVPMSPLHGEMLASYLWMIVAHYDLTGVIDAELTGSFSSLLGEVDINGTRIKGGKVVL